MSEGEEHDDEADEEDWLVRILSRALVIVSESWLELMLKLLLFAQLLFKALLLQPAVLLPMFVFENVDEEEDKREGEEEEALFGALEAA